MMQPRPSGIVPKLFYTPMLSISNMELEISNFENRDRRSVKTSGTTTERRALSDEIQKR